MVRGLAETGWTTFAFDAATFAWSQAAERAGRAALADPALAHWHQCEGTWFVGVDALPNDAGGAVGGVALAGPAIDALAPLPRLHPAQVSVVFPGYPRPRAGESAAAFRYRQTRDAAHVDGIIAEGPARRRHLREPHAWILGLPLSDSPAGAAPLVVWEGSHHIMREAFARAFDGVAPEHWGDVDVTGIYQDARRRVFETCRRVPVHARPGEAYVIHRLALHGVAPWSAPDGPGRMIAYFRPLVERVADWLKPDQA